MRIVIWGNGEISKKFKGMLCKDVEIIAYIDKKANELNLNKNIYTIEKFVKHKMLYDYIVVASVYSTDIWKECVENDIDLKKVVFLRPFQSDLLQEEYFRNLEVLKSIAPEYIQEAYNESGKRMGIDSANKPVLDVYPLYDWDYFRYRTFELVADQIASLKGDIAEVGVFKGYFAKIINTKFPKDTLYLFDTFEGFLKEEAKKELENGHCNQKFIQTFTDTSVDQVLNKLPYKDKCIIKKGFFPETAADIDTLFKFVSIDVDFEDSTYAALEWFYPRLVNNGMIFMHDYNEPTLNGVKNAVKRYEAVNGVLKKVPIADKCGTIIIIK